MANKKTTGWKEMPVVATIESPTWGDLKRMAEVVMNRLGGPTEVAKGMSSEVYYTLCLLESLMLSEEKAKLPIFGQRFLS